jgi:hypothetical protein
MGQEWLPARHPGPLTHSEITRISKERPTAVSRYYPTASCMVQMVPLKLHAKFILYGSAGDANLVLNCG